MVLFHSIARAHTYGHNTEHVRSRSELQKKDCVSAGRQCLKSVLLVDFKQLDDILIKVPPSPCLQKNSC